MAVLLHKRKETESGLGCGAVHIVLLFKRLRDLGEEADVPCGNLNNDLWRPHRYTFTDRAVCRVSKDYRASEVGFSSG